MGRPLALCWWWRSGPPAICGRASLLDGLGNEGDGRGETMRTTWSAAVRSAFYYEMRAEEVRTIAEWTHDPWCRRVLSAIVDDYMRLAADRVTLDDAKRRLLNRRRPL